jgi:hypothetical protein
MNGLSAEAAVLVLEAAADEVTAKPWLVGDDAQAARERTWFETALLHLAIDMAATDLVEGARSRAAHVLIDALLDSMKDCNPT